MQAWLLPLIFMANPSYAIPVARPDVVQVEDRAEQGRQSILPAIATAQDILKAKLIRVGNERAESAVNPYPDVTGIHANLDEAYERGKDFDVVSVVNKAQCAKPLPPLSEGRCQSVTVYRFKTENGRRFLDETKTFPVSTGQERWVCEEVKDKDKAVIGLEARWTGTPTGYYTPYFLHPDHHSNAYDDANMFKAVFFNRLGIAFHQASTRAFEAGLGRRASHGCVRMSENDSETMFKWVLASGGPVNLDSEGVCPSPDQLSPDQLVNCRAAALARGRKWKQMIESAVSEGQSAGYGPYSPEPMIPDLQKDGTPKRDGAGQPQMKRGYRTLVIIQCLTSTGADCSTAEIPERPSCNGETSVSSPPTNPQPQVQSQSQPLMPPVDVAPARPRQPPWFRPAPPPRDFTDRAGGR